MADGYARYLDAEIIKRIGRLGIGARRVVEGFMTGLHESPYKGSSVEFAEHREYVPGDDVRYIDWNVYARTDRYYIKEFEEETNLKTYVVVDTSKSMAYAGEGRVSKLETAKTVASTLLYLVQRQRDAGSLIGFGKDLGTFLPPASSPAHFRNALTQLAAFEPEGETELSSIFQEVAERLRSRSLVVILSDFLDDDREGVLSGLQRMSSRGHDVIVGHILDPDEVDFPFQRITRFEGLEIDDKVLAEPRALAEAYRAEAQGWIDEVEATCRGGRMDYLLLDGKRPLEVVLPTFLAQRAGTR